MDRYETTGNVTEQEKGGGCILDFHHLDTATEARLKARITANNGRVVIMVHPFYEKFKDSTDPLFKNRATNVENNIKRYFSPSSKSDRALLIIMEEGEKIPSLQARINKYPKSKNEALVIATESNGEQPLDKDGRAEGDIYDRWDFVITKLIELGVKEIVIGGRNLTLSGSHNELLGGCVGRAAGYLRNKFKVTLSFDSAPYNRTDSQFAVLKLRRNTI